jgi:hypothetical protein
MCKMQHESTIGTWHAPPERWSSNMCLNLMKSWRASSRKALEGCVSTAQHVSEQSFTCGACVTVCAFRIAVLGAGHSSTSQRVPCAVHILEGMRQRRGDKPRQDTR